MEVNLLTCNRTAKHFTSASNYLWLELWV